MDRTEWQDKSTMEEATRGRREGIGKMMRRAEGQEKRDLGGGGKTRYLYSWEGSQ
jgi:hypothetical protein